MEFLQYLYLFDFSVHDLVEMVLMALSALEARNPIAWGGARRNPKDTKQYNRQALEGRHLDLKHYFPITCVAPRGYYPFFGGY